MTKANGDRSDLTPFRYSDGSIINTFPTPVCLPDFELSELRLSPRFSTVDLGKVKSVRLKVDVHGVHTQQTHRSALPHDYKNGKKMSVFVVSAAFSSATISFVFC